MRPCMPRFSNALAAAGVALTLASASSGSAAGSAWDAGSGANWQAILSRAKQEGSVTVGSPQPLPEVVAQFEKDTGITVNVVTGTGGTITAKFDTSARAHHESIDVLFGGGSELTTLLPENLLTPIKPQLVLPSVQEGRNWIGGKWQWWDDAGEYFFEGTTSIFGFLTYNGDMVKAVDVATWNDLLKPKFKGKIVCYDPNSPGPGAGAIGAMAKVLGMDYVTKLIRDQHVTFVQNSDQEMADIAHGEYPIGIAVTTLEITLYQRQAINIKVALPAPMPGYLTHPNGVIIEAVGAPDPAAAQVFINWWASRPGQQAYQDDVHYISNRTDVDKSTLPAYSVPKPGVRYFDEGHGQEFYTTERKAMLDKVAALIGGR